MFDSAVFAPWPRGLYLAKRLSEGGRKTAYVEILPRIKSPFGLFLDDNSQEEKEFLSVLGFLFRQEGGFCLLNPEGVWPLQDMREMGGRHPVLKRTLTEDSANEFKEHWLSYLSLNMAGKIFEYNNSEFSDRTLNLFSDYFLFEPSFKKIERFQKDHPEISFYKFPLEEISCNEKGLSFAVQKELLEAKKYFWLGGNQCPGLNRGGNCKAQWEWSACFFNVDFGDYEEIIPTHFVSVRKMLLPWSHENLLSVFRKKGYLEIWTRLSYGNKQSFLKEIKEHLEGFFPGCIFSPMNKESPKGLTVYGKNSLRMKSSVIKNRLYIEDLNVFFQGDLVSEIKAEREFFDSL